MISGITLEQASNGLCSGLHNSQIQDGNTGNKNGYDPAEGLSAVDVFQKGRYPVDHQADKKQLNSNSRQSHLTGWLK
jgi:hypothetical protein